MLLISFPAQSDHGVRGPGFHARSGAAGGCARHHDHPRFRVCRPWFDGYRPPSILQVDGAKEIAVEIFSMSKSYNMAGWRVGYCLGNPKMIGRWRG